MSFWDYFQAIAVICIVIYGAYYVTKLFAKTSGNTMRKNTNIKLIGSLPLAKDKSVKIVSIGDHAYVLGVSAHHVERLDKLPLSEFDLMNEETATMKFGESFKEVLSARFKPLRK